MTLRNRFFVFVLAGLFWLPGTAMAIDGDGDGDGKSNCPKKEKVEKEDSAGVVDIYEAENKGLGDYQMLEFNGEERRATPRPNSRTADERQTADDGEEEGSAMSFNFIYYIIDKFKFTDPLE